MTTPSDGEYLERLSSRYVVNPESGCWEWVGRRDRYGYGIMFYAGKDRKAHRLALSLRGVSVDGGQVLHACDNPPCVNPAHLSVGDHGRNMKDMVARGRSAGCSQEGGASPSV